MGAVILVVTFRNDNAQWKKGFPVSYWHRLLQARKLSLEALQQAFLMSYWPELGHMLLPKPITGMMKGITMIGASNEDSLVLCFLESVGEEWAPGQKWGHYGNEARGMAAGQAFTAVTLDNWC